MEHPLIGVPRVELTCKHVSAVMPLTWRCPECEMPFAAATPEALEAAFDAHAVYVNACADKATDPHFAAVRLDALVAAR